MKAIEGLVVKSSAPPTVEIDSAARAAYVRFSRAKVSKTLSDDRPGVVVTVDLDSGGHVVGVELLGMKELTIECILRHMPVKVPSVNWERARFVSGRSRESVGT